MYTVFSYPPCDRLYGIKTLLDRLSLFTLTDDGVVHLVFGPEIRLKEMLENNLFDCVAAHSQQTGDFIKQGRSERSQIRHQLFTRVRRCGNRPLVFSPLTISLLRGIIIQGEECFSED